MQYFNIHDVTLPHGALLLDSNDFCIQNFEKKFDNNLVDLPSLPLAVATLPWEHVVPAGRKIPQSTHE